MGKAASSSYNTYIGMKSVEWAALAGHANHHNYLITELFERNVRAAQMGDLIGRMPVQTPVDVQHT